MGKNTAISWADHTFNPWWGCVQVGAGCAHCYAKAFAERMGYDIWGAEKERRLFAEKHWNDPIRWNRAARKAGEQHKVFCGSMCDLFEIHEDLEYNAFVLDKEREKVWGLIEDTPHLVWMLLTKRPGNLWALLPERWIRMNMPRNVWFGISASTQEEIDTLWSILDSEAHYLEPPVLFLSLEPLIEPVNLTSILTEIDCGDEEHEWWSRAPDWVIVGAESGKDRRPFEVTWAEGIYEQCQDADVAFFGKQDSGLRPSVPLLIHGKEIKEFPR